MYLQVECRAKEVQIINFNRAGKHNRAAGAGVYFDFL